MNIVARFAAALAAVLVVGGGLAGCDTDPGAAAVVGDWSVSTSTLQHEVDLALSDPGAQAQLGGDRVTFTRGELTNLINNHLLAVAAAERSISVTTAETDQQLAQFEQQAGGQAQLEQAAAQSGVPASEIRQSIRNYVLEQKLGDALVADEPVSRSQLEAAYQQNIDQFDQVHAAHILVKSKALADKILAEVRQDPSRFAALAKKYSIDTSNSNNGGDLGTQPQSKFVPAFAKPVFAAKSGSFIEVHSQFGWHVVHIITHQKVPLAQAAPQLKSSILGSVRQTKTEAELAALADRLGVHVNPRYGKWDPKQHAVVALAADHEVSSPAPSPGGAGTGAPIQLPGG